MNTHGRTTEQWEELIAVASDFLKKVARLKRITTYTDLNRELEAKASQPSFDFSSPEGRNAMGDLLGDVVMRTYDERPGQKLMLSVLVMYLNENKPGAGFYNLAVYLGLLAPDASSAEKEEFWVEQSKAVYSAYAKKSSAKRNRSGNA